MARALQSRLPCHCLTARRPRVSPLLILLLSAEGTAFVASAPPLDKIETTSPEHDIPAQSETSANHTSIPAPAITAVSERDPAKDRTNAATSLTDTAGTKPVSSDPGVSAATAKAEGESHPTSNAAESTAATTGTTAAGYGGVAVAHVTPAPVAADINPAALGPAPTAAATNPAATHPASNTNTTAAASATSGGTAPPPVTKDAAPITPAKNGTATPSSTTTTPSTQKLGVGHPKAATDGDIRKRKSSFFSKVSSLPVVADPIDQTRLLAQG